MFREGIKVRVKDFSSSFYGDVGVIWSRGNGTCWQVGFDKIGIYFFESELEVV
jgi:hypothetical protein